MSTMQEAIELLVATDFALVIVDSQLTGVDVVEVAQAVHEHGHDTTVIVVTDAAPTDDVVIRACQLAVVDFIVRPIHVDVLRAKAGAFLQLHARATAETPLKLLRDHELPRLLDAERSARTAAEAARARTEFLAHAGAMLALSLDYEDTLRAVATAAVPGLADWCAIDLVVGDTVKSVAVAHVDPAKIDMARNLREKYPPSADASAVLKVIRTGCPELYSDESALAVTARDAEHLRIATELGLRSAMLVPIKTRGTTIGVITFVVAESCRWYTQEDLAMAMELGERSGAAIANAQLYDEATTAVRLNEMFAGVVGHDLRNPLASIMAAAQLLLTRATAVDVGPLQRIVSSTDRMSRMIDQLLDFTRIRAGGGMPSEPKPMELSTVTSEVVDELRQAHPDRELELHSVGDLFGSWDADRLAQLLSNLVSNAIEHGSDQEPVTIAVDGTAADSLSIRVSNLGAIPADLVPVVFEPFRGLSYTRHRGAGLGLGLYVAQQIAIVHGGTIELTTSDPRRTTFTVTLPRVHEGSEQR